MSNNGDSDRGGADYDKPKDGKYQPYLFFIPSLVDVI